MCVHHELCKNEKKSEHNNFVCNFLLQEFFLLEPTKHFVDFF